ncbi:MAG: hypothetical protein NDI77_07075 [Geobacteraceae bacterium]|nr:hypothetical protein [Geobacteraceae bacterium]
MTSIPNLWLVKDTDGEEVTVKAHSWTLSIEGLSFHLNDVKVAHFIRWASYREWFSWGRTESAGKSRQRIKGESPYIVMASDQL